MVRMPGFGLDGPWRDNPAFAYVIEDTSGLTWLTGHPDRNPLEPYSIGDPNAGVHAAQRPAAGLGTPPPHRKGVLVEARDGRCRAERRRRTVHRILRLRRIIGARRQPGPRGRPAEPLPRLGHPDEFGREDCWVAIAVGHRRSVARALSKALGDPSWAPPPACPRPPGAGANTMPVRCPGWANGAPSATATRSSESLWEAGVPVAKVMQPHRQPEIPQLKAPRNFFEAGLPPRCPRTARHSTVPIRFSAGPDRFHRSPPPAAGPAHRRSVPAALGLGARRPRRTPGRGHHRPGPRRRAKDRGYLRQ